MRFLLLLCCLAIAAAVEGDLNRVRDLAGGNEKNRAEALKLAGAIAEDAARPEAERFRARRLVPELMIGLGQLAEARAAAAALAKAGNARATGYAAVLEALALIKEGRRDDGIAQLRAQLRAGDAQAQAEAGWHLARLLAVEEKGKKTPPEVFAEVVTLAEAAGAALEDLRDAEQALLAAQHAAERTKDTAAYERIQRRFLAPPLLTAIHPGQRDDHAGRLGRVLEESKRFAEARTLYTGQLALADTDLPRWRYAIARSYEVEGDIAKAVEACEDVFMAGADPGNAGNEAQRLIVDSLAADPQRQAAAALTWYGIENHPDVAKRLGQILGGKDAKQVKLITDWYLHGSNGPDKAAGTADDIADPKPGIQPAVYPKRAAAAAAVPLTSGVLARRRATLLAWAGKPAEVAALARWWMGQGRSAAEYGTITETLARCAVAMSGDASVRGRTLRFFAYGPAGEDGKAGTADDIADPLAGIAAFVPPVPAGEDAAALHRLRTAAAGVAGDDRAHPHLRGDAFATLVRIDLLFSQQPQPEELLPWLDQVPSGVHESMCAGRIARDGHLRGLPEVYAQLDAAGWSKQPNWVKDRRKGWDDLAKALQAGSPYRQWWP
jgi:hypothetical protein